MCSLNVEQLSLYPMLKEGLHNREGRLIDVPSFRNVTVPQGTTTPIKKTEAVVHADIVFPNRIRGRNMFHNREGHRIIATPSPNVAASSPNRTSPIVGPFLQYTTMPIVAPLSPSTTLPSVVPSFPHVTPRIVPASSRSVSSMQETTPSDTMQDVDEEWIFCKSFSLQ